MKISPVFSSDPRETVQSWGETGLIKKIHAWFGDLVPPGVEGIGDDAAVLPPTPHGQLITVDPVLLGQHFDEKLPAELAGRKLLNRNISDIAAMGGVPTRAVLALMLPPSTRCTWLEEFCHGLAAAAREAGVLLVGGDVTSAKNELGGFLTLLGETEQRILTRGGVAPGDLIWVTGSLGGSLREERHARFSPRLKEGQWLARQTEVKAMMDCSDGLAKDLPALLGPGHLAWLDEKAIPLHPSSREMAETSGQTPLYHACCDGEDYELIFVTDQSTDPGELARKWAGTFPLDLSLIGEVTIAGSPDSPAAILWRHQTFTDWHGYEHLV